MQKPCGRVCNGANLTTDLTDDADLHGSDKAGQKGMGKNEMFSAGWFCQDGLISILAMY
jgi:hypothetical protein